MPVRDTTQQRKVEEEAEQLNRASLVVRTYWAGQKHVKDSQRASAVVGGMTEAKVEQKMGGLESGINTVRYPALRNGRRDGCSGSVAAKGVHK